MIDFGRLGIPRNVPLLVHTAFKPFAREGNTPQELIEILLERNGPLLMPAFTPKLGKFDYDAPTSLGVVPELFRTAYSTERSRHPTHSFCGWSAIDCLKPDSLTLLGHDSPLASLVTAGGWILMAGAGIDNCSLIHHAEEMVAPEIYLDDTGRKHRKLKRDYWKVQDVLARLGLLHSAFVGCSTLLAFSARDCFKIASEMLMNDRCALLSDTRWRLM